MTAETPRAPDRARVGLPGRLTAGRGMLAGTVTVLLCGLVAVVWGVTTASVQYSFGPHEARYEVTTDSTVTLDLGPLGTVQMDSPLRPLGGRVTVQEIPQDVVALGQVTTLEALGEDLERYVQFFDAPEATLQGAVRGLVVDAARRTVLFWVLLLAGVAGTRMLLGPARRTELRRALAPHRAVIARAAAIALVVLLWVPASTPQAATRTGPPPSRVFAGTPLEGARVTGRLSGVIDTYGGLIIDAIEQNDRFYAAVVADLERAWAARAEVESTLPFPPLPETTVTMLVVSDLHCNVGMAPVIRRAAELSGVEIVLDAGDTTVNGTAVESYCITSFASAVPDGAQVVVATGNHDSEITAGQQRAAGMTVLQGEPVEVAGVRILGDQDPHATRIGSGTAPAGQETLAEAADRLAEVACADEQGIDLLLVHTPRVGDPTLQQGCAPVQVSGHMHTRIGPYLVGQGVRYVSASTAGAALGRPTVGPLNAPAEMTVLTFDLESREMLSYRLVVIQPDGTALVGFRLEFPTARELGAVGAPGAEGAERAEGAVGGGTEVG